MDKKWIIGIACGLLSLLLTQFFVIYSITKNQEISKEMAMIHFGQGLEKEFFATEEANFRDIRMAIEECHKLYKNYDGKFDNDQINRYLDFFDSLGFYYKKGVIDLDVIDEFFGAYIIEAYEYNELKRYVSELQENAKQKSAFVEFQSLAKDLEKIPERQELIEISKRGCLKQI